MRFRLTSTMVVLGLATLLAGCDELDRDVAVQRATPTPFPPGFVTTPTPRPSPTSYVVTGRVAAKEDDLERSVAEARQALQRALGSPGLPGIEALLLERVAISAPSGGETVDRAAATRWLRERAGPGLHVGSVHRHHHLPMLVAQTAGGRVTFVLHRYDASGMQDDLRGDWKIDTISVS